MSKLQMIDNKKKLIILAIIAVALRSFVFLSQFIDYELSLRLPDFLIILENILTLLPAIVFIICVCKFYDQEKEKLFTAITFAIFVLANVYVDIYYITVEYPFTVKEVIFDIIFIILFALSAFNVFKGHYKKNLIIATIAVAFIGELVYIVQLIGAADVLIESDMIFFLCVSIADTLGFIALYTGLFLLSIEHCGPIFVATASEKENTADKMLIYENELKLLKKKFDLDMISEIEYKTKRADIINEL